MKLPVIRVEIFYKEALIVRKSTEKHLEKEEQGGVRKTQEGEMGPALELSGGHQSVNTGR